MIQHGNFTLMFYLLTIAWKRVLCQTLEHETTFQVSFQHTLQLDFLETLLEKKYLLNCKNYKNIHSSQCNAHLNSALNFSDFVVVSSRVCRFFDLDGFVICFDITVSFSQDLFGCCFSDRHFVCVCHVFLPPAGLYKAASTN